MSSVWDERAEAYRTSEAHREGEDLDLLVEWSQGAKTALDVATGGGHVARRFREAGLEVVSLDPAAGMQPDVVAPAESLPFDEGSFDVVACRVAAHHFEDVRVAVQEMGRVARDLVLMSDNLFVGEEAEEADRVRDPSHVRNYTEAEWRGIIGEAGLGIDDMRFFSHTFDFAAWLARTGCEGEEAQRAEELLGDRVADGRLTLDKIAIRAARGF